MPDKISANFAISIILIAAIVCFAFGALVDTGSNYGKADSEMTDGSDLAERQVILNTKPAICIPEAIVSAREDNASASEKIVQEISRRCHNKQSVVFILLMLLLCPPVLMRLQFRHSAVKIVRADMPVLALSLGGNAPPVIRA